MSTTCEEIQPQQDVPDLVPARMLNEFAYCPRLAYLEWVQGEFTDNLETNEGRFGHRRVDKPDRREVPEPVEQDRAGGNGGPHPSPLPEGEGTKAGPDPEGENEVDRLHSRSVMLSAPSEKLIAKIDLLDLENSVAVPIDYKRGRVPDVPGNAWEPEAVQLCAQGLILRENGYQCEGGILYYIQSHRRIPIPFDETLVDRTRELVEQLRAMAAEGRMPPPLDDSPKCPRCSLVGICLPDETNLLACQPGEGHDKVRRLLPARDDALPLYVQEQGCTVGKQGDQLTVSKRGQVLRKVRLLDVSQICLFGNAQLTAQALREVAAAGIPVCHFSYGGWFHALTSGLIHKNVELRMRQFAVAADSHRSLRFARRWIVGKIKNSRTLLRRHLPHDARQTLVELNRLGRKALRAPNAATLLGIEGMAAKVYFAGFAQLLKGGEVFDLDGRNRRPPRDPVNAVLSFVYAMLTKELTVVLHAVGFDPMLGFFHRPRYGRPSLALDMAEEFRPLLADSVVLTLINNGEVSESSFLRRAGAVVMTDGGRRAVIAAFERRMDTLVTHPVFGYRISYRRVLEVQARLLARALLGEINGYPFFHTR
jgi:CRISPR-associated protein Cas1